eukprot:scaffold146289_cov42-Prasinocladus_malaysianus.AAC.1
MVPTNGARTVQWADVRWPNHNITSVDDVSIELADLTDPFVRETLGSWVNVSFSTHGNLAPSLTCKPDPARTKLYTGEIASVNLCPYLEEALTLDGVAPEDAATAHPTHTFQIEEEGGELFANVIAVYNDTTVLES